MTSQSGYRGRRLRKTAGVRSLVRESRLDPGQLIAPVFLCEDAADAVEVAAMPGLRRWTANEVAREIDAISASGVRGVMLFGLPAHKDDVGSGAWAPDGVIPQAIRAVRRAAPDIVIITDVCLCQYTSHGHCGIVCDGAVDNDETLPVLAKAATSHAEAGADFVAPSAMMDGMVTSIRSALDESGHAGTGVLSYAVKYASAFYGPFREAARSRPGFGDRRTHQMDPANRREGVREARQDVAEGADVVMVKPAGPCLDVICDVRRSVDVPVAAYQVSGEYAMIRAAGEHGWIDERAVAMESLLAIRRAGADMIVTYFARQVASWLGEDSTS